MSTVVRPRGPLPPRVYWTRRVLLVVLALAVLAGVRWLLPDGSPGPAAASSAAGTTASSTSPTTGSDTAPRGGRSTDGGASSPPHVTHRTGPAHRSSTPPTTQIPLSAPTGPCNPATTALSIVAQPAVEGAGTSVRLLMATTNGSTCSLGITPALLELRITSSKGPVWQSSSCPDGLAAKNVVVRPQAKVVYTLRWDGRVSPDVCRGGGSVAPPGPYGVEAALIGGTPATTSFAVTPPQH